MGDIEGSKADFLESIKLVPSFTQSLVKIASVYMEQNEPVKAFECFEEAIKHNPNDPDIYYHRGQGMSSISTCSDVDPDFLPPQSSIHHGAIQGCRRELH